MLKFSNIMIEQMNKNSIASTEMLGSRMNTAFGNLDSMLENILIPTIDTKRTAEESQTDSKRARV